VPLSGNSLSAARPAHCRLSFAMKAPGDMFLKPSSSPERLSRCRHPSNSHLAKGERISLGKASSQQMQKKENVFYVLTCHGGIDAPNVGQ
jgi:hypothetical protein